MLPIYELDPLVRDAVWQLALLCTLALIALLQLAIYRRLADRMDVIEGAVLYLADEDADPSGDVDAEPEDLISYGYRYDDYMDRWLHRHGARDTAQVTFTYPNGSAVDTTEIVRLMPAPFQSSCQLLASYMAQGDDLTAEEQLAVLRLRLSLLLDP